MVTITAEHFDLGQICDSGQCFRMRPLAERTFEVIAGDKYLEVSQEGRQVTFFCDVQEYEQFWKSYFDLDTDYGEYIKLINPNDTYLVQAAAAGDGVRILRQELWEMIVTFLISQQNNIRRIRHCIELLCEKYGTLCTTENGRQYYGFPGPESLADLPEDGLMECNLGYRSKYVVRTARAVTEGEIDLKKIREMPCSQAKAELLKCFGVGEKVADCICLFALHHLQSFPVDTHIRQVLDEHYRRGFPNRRYRSCRGVMQQYIFYYELHEKDRKS